MDKKAGANDIQLNYKVLSNQFTADYKFYSNNGKLIATLDGNELTIKINQNEEFCILISNWKWMENRLYGIKARVTSSLELLNDTKFLSKIKQSPNSLNGQVSNFLQ